MKQYILSDKASTDKEIKEEPFTPLTSEEITQLLVENVKGVESMRDRTGSTPVVTYIISTTTKGLPLFAGSKATNEHTKKALQYILYKARDLPEKIRKPLLTRLADGFTACQMEQGRVIDSIYGSLSGRDKSFKEQVLALVDIQKEQVLNMVVAHFNPNAWKTDDGNPKGQIPHIQSAYVYEIGTDLGLRGVKAAKLDKDRPTVLFSSNIKTTFLSLFQIEELISNFVNDVNQQDKEAERVISLKSLMDWAGDTENNNGFDPYCIFYDEDVRKYDGTPKEENAYQPYINRQVAISIMNHLFLKK
uniref:Uncharacterized protein n=1 Tax=Arcella intermedia TaxID=1963864 RepID=A0A6B2L647_9EUKA